MTDEPERLLHGGGSDLERLLLRSAAAEEPSSRSMKRAAVALAAATGASTLTKTLWAARDFVQPLTTTAGKAVAGSVLVGTAAFVAATQSSLPPAPPFHAAEAKAVIVAQQPAISLESIIAEEESEGSEVTASAEEESPAAREAAASSAARPATKVAVEAPVSLEAVEAAPEVEKVERPAIAEEIAALDAARALLDKGNATGALKKLDVYAKNFPQPRLGQEAVVMRIRALMQLGQRSRAQALADSFQAKNPSSPYNKRIESIVSGQ